MDLDCVAAQAATAPGRFFCFSGGNTMSSDLALLLSVGAGVIALLYGGLSINQCAAPSPAGRQ